MSSNASNDNPVALITGAGRGIGRAAAIALAQEGFRVAILSRSRPELEVTASMVRATGAEAMILKADVTQEEDVRNAFDLLQSMWGDLRVLINNAGWAAFSRIEVTSIEDWNANLVVNLTGTFLCCREAIPSLVRSGRGVIVNIASSAGKKGYSTQGAYTAAKHGVMGLSKVLAIELQDRGVRVHCVCPGGVDTKLAKEIHPGRNKADWMKPEDIAEVIRFLVTRPHHLTIDEIVVRRFKSDVMF